MDESQVDARAKEVAVRGLELARRTVDDARVVLAAVRARPDARAIDQLTLAVPRMDREPPMSAGVGNAERARPRITSEVNIDGLVAMSTRSLAPSESEQGSQFIGSDVQLVFAVPGGGCGAILTLVSTLSCDEERLERDAEEIAGSVRIARSHEDG